MSGTFYYDGNCGLCSRAVTFLKRHDTKQGLAFRPLQSSEAAARLPLELTESLDTAVYLSGDDPAKLYLRSDAVLQALAVLGPIWRILAKVLGFCPLSLRNYCYNQVAKRRHYCALPTEGN
jgi:predicted DCC family thiol-disulfide oxidoreductase YuxK